MDYVPSWPLHAFPAFARRMVAETVHDHVPDRSEALH
jgi:hypothetical protein